MIKFKDIISKIKDILENGIFNNSTKEEIVTKEFILGIPIDLLDSIYATPLKLLLIPTLFHRITLYTKELRIIVQALKDNRELDNRYKSISIVDTELSVFLLDTNNFYINRNKYLKYFLLDCDYILKYYYLNQGEKENYTVKYNLRILKYIVENLEQILNRFQYIYKELNNVRESRTKK